MKADKELIEYIEKRHALMRRMTKSAPSEHAKTYSSGGESELRTLLEMLKYNDETGRKSELPAF